MCYLQACPQVSEFRVSECRISDFKCGCLHIYIYTHTHTYIIIILTGITAFLISMDSIAQVVIISI